MKKIQVESPEDHEDSRNHHNPWGCLRWLLYILWTIHFFLLGGMTVGQFEGNPFGLEDIVGIALIIIVDALWVRQVHFYFMGQLEPMAAMKMQGVQCLIIALIVVDSWNRGGWDAIAVVFFLPWASTFFVLFSVSLAAFGAERRRRRYQSVELSEYSDV